MTSPSDRPFDLLDYIKYQNDFKAALCKDLKSKIISVPVTQEVLDGLFGLMPDDREDVLREHPGSALEQALESLWRMLDVFRLSHTDLVAQFNAFAKFSESSKMHTRVERPGLYSIQSRLNKELVAFSAAAGALVYFSRRLPPNAGLPDHKAKLSEYFDDAEHRFVISLRNLICHEALPNVSWRIDYGPPQGRSTDFILSLRSVEGSSGAGRDYLSRWPDGIRLSVLTQDYAQRVNAFYTWLRDACEASPPSHLADYRRVIQACKAHSSRQMYRMLISQGLNRNVDPYRHLGDYLFPDQLEAALSLPMRSIEQVDFIIRTVDEFGVCDVAMREQIYRLFQVQ